MITGAVFAWRVVKISANTYSFQANTTTKIATAMSPGTTSGSTTRTEDLRQPGAVDRRGLLQLDGQLRDERAHDPGAQAHVERGVEQDQQQVRVVQRSAFNTGNSGTVTMIGGSMRTASRPNADALRKPAAVARVDVAGERRGGERHARARRA